MARSSVRPHEPRHRPMDPSRFDALARSLTLAGSRRRALGGLLFGTLGHVASRPDEVGAKKKKPCPPCKKRKKGKCKKKLPDGTPCAGGACQDGRCVAVCTPPCTDGRVCQAGGVCACPPDRLLVCPGSSVCSQCCEDDDCSDPLADSRSVCRDGRCVCTDPRLHRCPSGTSRSGQCGTCCGNDECPGAEQCTTQGSQPPRCVCGQLGNGPRCNTVCIPTGCDGRCQQPCFGFGQACCDG